MKWLLVAAFVLLACGAMGNIKKETNRLHKKYRKKHGVPKLKWDAKVADFAQKHCEYLAANNKFEHSKDSEYGENLYMAGGSGASTGAGKKAVKAWYNERKDYDYDNPGFFMKTVHFTQV
jgi:uncharacterized protein YkwD